MDVTALFDAHYGAVVAYARRRGASWDDAHEVATETFTIAWRRRDHVDIPTGAERAWLLGVARRVLANRWRGERRRRALVSRLASAARVDDAPDAADLAPADPGLARAFALLPARDREVLRLVVWDGLTHAEIAAVLGCSVTAVHSRVVRARTRLRRALDAQAEPSMRAT